MGRHGVANEGIVRERATAYTPHMGAPRPGSPRPGWRTTDGSCRNSSLRTCSLASGRHRGSSTPGSWSPRTGTAPPGTPWRFFDRRPVALLVRQNPGDAEAHAAVAGPGLDVAAGRRPAARRDEVPATAAQHAVRARRRSRGVAPRRRLVIVLAEPIRTPFPHVPVHVA